MYNEVYKNSHIYAISLTLRQESFRFFKYIWNEEGNMKINKDSKWISFLGGQELIFSLAALFILGGVFFVFSKVPFVFHPLTVTIRTVLVPLLLTLILYYVLNPLIKWLEKHGIKREYGIIAAFFLLIFVLSTFIFLATPILVEQVEGLVTNFPEYLVEIENLIEQLSQDSRFEEIISNGIEALNQWIEQVMDNAEIYLENFILGITTVFTSITHSVLLALTVPVITFFLLKDDRLFFNFVLSIVPPKFREDLREIVATMDDQVGAYLKGQVVVSFIIGGLTFAGFLVIQMPLAGALSLFVGLTAIIPYIGPVLAFLPCAIVALIDSPSMLIQMCIVWVVVQLLNGELIEPQVMGKHMVIHPVTIIFVLWVMGDLLGLFGLIFGIPFYAIVKVLVVFLFRKFKIRYNNFYGSEGRYEEIEFSKESYTQSKENP